MRTRIVGAIGLLFLLVMVAVAVFDLTGNDRIAVLVLVGGLVLVSVLATLALIAVCLRAIIKGDDF